MSVSPFSRMALDIELDLTTILVLITIGLILFLLWFVPRLLGFLEELRYINMEIGRTDGREQAHWIKKKKKLWLSWIPFYPYY
ncbi:MAG: hypothetical protein IJN76_01875 [Clostridia bacterium]|nr:hypothetical protein [Clostridia bacterium]